MSKKLSEHDKEMIGARFGKLTVIEKAGVNKSPNGRTNSRWLCKCECGKTVTPMRHDLKGNKHLSCGVCSKPAYVYFIRDGKFLKIGYALSPEKRLGELQIGNHRDLILEAKFLCQNPKAVEKELHEIFDKYLVRGEWFKVRPKKAERAIKKIINA